MDESLLTINVSIAEKIYPILIERKDEEEIRKAAKLLNEKILEFKKKYPVGADSKISSTDYIVMAAMQLSMKCVQLHAQKDIELFAGKINLINEELDDYLKSE